MKQLAAILLLGIFSFNMIGYRLVASFLEYNENNKMELALDASDYRDDQLIAIKQATNLPYYQNNETFQRINGEIELEGVLYQYVKCRIYNDSLELLCIPNTGKMKIQAAKDDFSKMAADVQQNNSKKKQEGGNKSFHKTTSEFEALPLTDKVTITTLHLNYSFCNHPLVNNLFSKTIEQPPDFLRA